MENEKYCHSSVDMLSFVHLSIKVVTFSAIIHLEIKLKQDNTQLISSYIIHKDKTSHTQTLSNTPFPSGFLNNPPSHAAKRYQCRLTIPAEAAGCESVLCFCDGDCVF